MRILLTGATGAVGRPLLPRLVAAGHEVIAMTRRPVDGVPGVRADIMDRAAVEAAVRSVRPEAVMHQVTSLAARDFRANGEVRRVGTRHLVDAALAAGVRRMVAQSIAFAYEPGASPATEQTPLDVHAAEPRRGSVLGAAALEEITAEMPEWVVLRYGTFYGPGTWLDHGGQAPAAGADVSSLVHVEDAAAAAVEALHWPSGAVNVCDDEPAPGSVWVPAFCAAIGVPAPEVSTAERHGWARGADNTYARKQLGWKPAFPRWREGFSALAAAPR